MADGSCYEKWFETEPLRDLFFAKLELLEGLFIDLLLEGKRVKLNPRFILKIESSAS